MKRLTQIFQALLGVVALILTAIVAAGRLAWRTIRNWWKRSSKWFRITFAIAISLISIGFVSIVGYVIYKENYGMRYWNVNQLSKNIMVYMFNDNTFRVYNRSMGKYTTPKLNWVLNAPQNDSLAVYAVKGKRGYINVNTGEITINAEDNAYRKAWVFSEGLAAVMKNNKVGFINAKNEIVIPFQYDYYNKGREYGFGYLFHNGYCVMTDKVGKLGLIDTAGKWIVNAVYDKISEPKRRGCRIVVKDGKYGILDSLCNVICPIEYSSLKIIPSGVVLAKEGRKWQVDFDGNVIAPFIFDDNDELYYPSTYCDCEDNMHNIRSDYDVYEVDGSYGIMNRLTGKPITPAIYDSVVMQTKNIFKVKNSKSHSWHLLDLKGRIVS